MNENIYLTQILKDCPRGTRLYTPLAGKVYLVDIKDKNEYQITVEDKDFKKLTFDYKGRCFTEFKDGECLLFPAIDQRDLSKFKVNKPKFDPNTLQPFDKVLARNFNYQIWHANIFSHVETDEDGSYYNVIKDDSYLMIIPYNEETKHLVGTIDEAPEYYRYWED